jgi:hypothetical protein
VFVFWVAANEVLDLAIDPRTGYVVRPAGAAADGAGR